MHMEESDLRNGEGATNVAGNRRNMRRGLGCQQNELEKDTSRNMTVVVDTRVGCLKTAKTRNVETRPLHPTLRTTIFLTSVTLEAKATRQLGILHAATLGTLFFSNLPSEEGCCDERRQSQCLMLSNGSVREPNNDNVVTTRSRLVAGAHVDGGKCQHVKSVGASTRHQRNLSERDTRTERWPFNASCASSSPR